MTWDGQASAEAQTDHRHTPKSSPASAPAATERSPAFLTATAAIAARPSCGEANLPGAKTHRVIKLGVDVHGREHVVVRQIDGTAPQPAPRFATEAFVARVAKQVAQADVVHCCYGPSRLVSCCTAGCWVWASSTSSCGRATR